MSHLAWLTNGMRVEKKARERESGKKKMPRRASTVRASVVKNRVRRASIIEMARKTVKSSKPFYFLITLLYKKTSRIIFICIYCTRVRFIPCANVLRPKKVQAVSVQIFLFIKIKDKSNENLRSNNILVFRPTTFYNLWNRDGADTRSFRLIF